MGPDRRWELLRSEVRLVDHTCTLTASFFAPLRRLLERRLAVGRELVLPKVEAEAAHTAQVAVGPKPLDGVGEGGRVLNIAPAERSL